MVDTGTLTPLSGEDARILQLESGPIRGHTLKLLIVDDAPGESLLDELRTSVGRRSHAVPRWRQRLVPAPDTPEGLAWQDDPDFRVDRHVQQVDADEPVDHEQLRRIVASAMTTRLDRGHPLWTVQVVPRLTDGRWALLWKVHHCLADGVAMARVGPLLLWTEDPTSVTPVPRQERRTTSGTAARTRVGTQAVTLARYVATVRREFRRVGPLSPLAGVVGPERQVAFTHSTLDELRRLGKAVAPQVTINDVLLASVAGALRRWLAARHRSAPEMKVQVPVSMHPSAEADEPAGNRDSFLLVGLPVAVADPIARVLAVNAETRLRKNRHDASTIYSLRESLSHAPGRVRGALQHIADGPHAYTLNVSNVPGPAGPVHVLGQRVDALYSIAEVARRHALRVAAVSMAGTLYVGMCADPTVVPELQSLATDLQDSVDELRQAVPGDLSG